LSMYHCDNGRKDFWVVTKLIRVIIVISVPI
jgi:hypothetical protein